VAYRELYNRRVAKPPKVSEDEIVKMAFDRSTQRDELEKLAAKLTPEEAQLVLAKLEATFKKRKLQATGYIIAIVAWAVAMLMALAYDGATDGFVGWVYFVPFAIVGLVLWVVGAWADRIGRSVPKATNAASKPDDNAKAV
jgi:hypothetical protein